MLKRYRFTQWWRKGQPLKHMCTEGNKKAGRKMPLFLREISGCCVRELKCLLFRHGGSRYYPPWVLRVWERVLGMAGKCILGGFVFVLRRLAPEHKVWVELAKSGCNWLAQGWEVWWLRHLKLNREAVLCRSVQRLIWNIDMPLLILVIHCSWPAIAHWI